jgi:hypothetical protein
VFLLGSRYCETDRFHEIPWQLFEKTPPVFRRVQAICDYVHDLLTFGDEYASDVRPEHAQRFQSLGSDAH